MNQTTFEIDGEDFYQMDEEVERETNLWSFEMLTWAEAFRMFRASPHQPNTNF